MIPPTESAESSRPRIAIWPVIHHRDIETSLENAVLAREAGCYGVFLISMVGDDPGALEAAMAIRQQVPEIKIGVNLLRHRLVPAIKAAADANLHAVWADNCGFSAGKPTDSYEPVLSALAAAPGLEFFGGVAFKYQPFDPKPAATARAVAELGWIPVTSGAGTGVAPAPQKLASLRAALPPGSRLGIASGVTPANFHTMAEYLSDVLVATGVSIDEHRLDPTLLQALQSQANMASVLG